MTAASDPAGGPGPGGGSRRGLYARLSSLWRADPKGMSLDLLRVGIGIVWSLNLLFILAPSNGFFSHFKNAAAGFESSTLGGPWFAGYVSAHPVLFAWGLAFLTGYLAFAFLAGFTTRLACFVGEIASAFFLITQFGSTFALNGTGTDVGPHPLYLLIYLILFAGGAGQYVAIDHWIWTTGRARLPRLSQWLASPHIVGTDVPPASEVPGCTAIPRPRPEPRPVLARSDQRFYNTVAVVSVLVVLGAFAAAYYGSAVAPGAPSAGVPSQMYLTIVVNPRNGLAQYSPANFTVPAGVVDFTILDQDTPMVWNGCTCNVTGTVGGTESVNGTPRSVVSPANAAHTFTIPALGLNVILPGESTVTFSVDLHGTGSFAWLCTAPCGTHGFSGPPMGVPGYMTGVMTVT